MNRSFPDQQRRNRWRLRGVLAAYFLLALAAGHLTGKAFQWLGDPDAYYAERYGIDTGYPVRRKGFDYVDAVTAAVLLLAWAEYRSMRRNGRSAVLSMVETRPLKERQWINSGAEMALAAQLQTPELWIVESDEPNAFSCTDMDGNASVAFTRALLTQLDRSEIQAVMAHEMAHVRHGDSRLITLLLGLGRVFHGVSAVALGPLRLFYDAAIQADHADDAPPALEKESPVRERHWGARNTILAVLATPLVSILLLAVGVTLSLTLFFFYSLLIVLFPWLVAAYALWQLVADRLPEVRRKLKQIAGRFPWLALLAFIPVGLVVGPAILVLGIVVPVLFGLLRLVVSRNREFQADATAVELTRNPDALCSALVKIRDGISADGGRLPRSLGALTIVPTGNRTDESPLAPWHALLDTHPPIEARIERLIGMGASDPRPA